jgi:hypothetical protein
MKLSIEAELVYNFASDTQVIANLEASRTSDQVILSETLDIRPPATILSGTTPYGDRSIRASLSGDVTIRYAAVVENKLRHSSAVRCVQHVRSDLPTGSAPDFRAIFEVYIQNGWWLIDPTRLAPIEGIVRIGSGRDASDIAFLTSDKQCQVIRQTIQVSQASYLG